MNDVSEVVGVVESVEELKPSQIVLKDVLISPLRLLSEHPYLVIPLGVNAGLALILALLGLGFQSNMTASAVIGYGFSALIISIFSSFTAGWVLVMMREISETGETTPESSFSVLQDNIARILAGAILSGLIVMIGTITLLVPGLILAVALSCTVPAIILNNLEPVDGLKASWKFTWEGENFWRLLGLFIVAFIISQIPILGSAIQAFIIPLLISYAYMKYSGGWKYSLEVSGEAENEAKLRRLAVGTAIDKTITNTEYRVLLEEAKRLKIPKERADVIIQEIAKEYGATIEVETVPSPAPSTFPQELLQKYTDVEYIGKGGFARVFKAKKDGKIVAVKIPISLDEETGKSFIREMKAWEKLEHENVIKLYDFNIMPIPYFEMEYGEKSLEDLEKPLDVEKAVKIVFDIAEGLKYVHARGIIHRDLKPQNVLLSNGIPKITDWGLSRVMAESRTTTTSFTPLYAAPEQISRKFGEIDERTDIYCLGVIFYELVTGRLPFSGSDIGEIMFKITNEVPEKPGRINPDAREVEPVIMRCIEKGKEDRYQNVEELQRDLADYLKNKYKRSLKESSMKKDVTRSRIFCGELVLLSAMLKDYSEVLKHLSVLRDYAGDDERKKIDSLIEEINYRVEKEIEFSDELVERIKVLVYRVKMSS